jgi:Glycosyltransferase family 87
MRKPVAVIAAVLAWIYTAAHFAASGVKQPLHNFYGDFLASFPSWRVSVLLGRLDLYRGSLAEYWALKFGGQHPLWHYGPVEHLVTLPLFAFSDLRAAYIAWLIVNYGFVAGILVFAFRGFDSGRPRWVWRSVAAIAILNYSPFYEALTQRDIEIFELLLIFVAYAMTRRGRETASGATIGLAIMTKFLPAVFLPYFLVKRKLRVLGSAAVVVAVIAIATEAVFGWRYSGIVVQLRRGGLINSELDQSLAGMILRLLAWTRSSLPPALLIRGATVLALLGLSWLFLRARNCTTIEDLEWSTLLVAMVLLPPHNEQYYFVFLLFPYLALTARELQPGRPHDTARWWLAISFLLTGAVPLAIISRLIGRSVFSPYLAFGLPFVGAAILATICVRAVLRECRPPHPSTPAPARPLQ